MYPRQYTTQQDPLVAIEHDVHADAQYHTLRRDHFIDAPSTTAAWLTLVNRAWRASRLPMDDDVRAYIVHMLARLTDNADLKLTAVGLQFYTREALRGIAHVSEVQQLADTCLVLVGLFPETLEHYRRMLSHEGAIGVGQALYGRVWRETDDPTFRTLAQHFASVSMVLQHTRPTTQPALMKRTDATLLARPAEAADIVDAARNFATLHFEQNETQQ